MPPWPDPRVRMIEITTLSELTIDGKLALHRASSSKELFDYSTSELKAWFHGQRALSDAIMVGANTVRVDDPSLTVRYVEGPSPLRVIPSSDGLLPLASALLNDGLPTLVAVARKANRAAVAALEDRPGVEVVCCGDDLVDMPALMELLAERGVRTLIAEGGSTLLSSLWPAIALTGWTGWLWLSALVVGASRLEQIVLIARGGRDLNAGRSFVRIVRKPR
jgi:riboflavin-specific deaminase-like protein